MSDLHALAAAYRIATENWAAEGRSSVPDETLIAVLAALGVDASTPERARAALEARRDEAWRRPLPPCVVHRTGHEGDVVVHVPAGTPAAVQVVLENGESLPLFQVDNWEPDREVDGAPVGEASFRLPAHLPLGYHTLQLVNGEHRHESRLIVCPRYLGIPERVGGGQIWGYAVQLYSVSSAASWGIGDLQDLADLAVWSAAQQGADYLLTNPLHAAEPSVPIGSSPYSPTSRRFINPIYVRPEAIDEYALLDEHTRAGVARLRGDLLAMVADGDAIDRDAVWTAKIAALQAIHDHGLTDLRQVSYDGFRARHGRHLVDYAAWCALTEEHGHDWRTWPNELRDPRSDEVSAYADRHRARVEFHCWLQWIAGEQMVAAQARAVDAGMRIGIMNDIAVGVGPASSEAWARHDTFATGVSVGAPPDAYNRLGQDWSQAPWRPDRMAELGYQPFRDMLRSMLAHSGGIRVDHIIGLFRLWWIPEGHRPTEGTYVRYDHDALVGILMLEAHRAGALVVGEDLGTVEGWVRDYLAERGVLGTSVLWFERGWDGAPQAADRFREMSMASVTTHDLAPTAGYLEHAHLAVRDRLGLLGRPLAAERADQEADLERWRSILTRRGMLRPGTGSDQTEDEILALHRHLRSTSARVLNAALTDAVGDRRMQNQPGTLDEYPNWRVPLTDYDGNRVTLESLVRSERAARLGAVMNGTEP
ncbi:4-alpha-glucanotransferase [Blastococcus sp. Marseille-P5729]|uniref:4-alpha-glucanotransferase n=1 Tax=Blastococcus sp. Marseille-P5729 TaxID=2086582 RepID=UPI000D1053DA|nr:4-alpha-glucanotransferase [Blastococcus sp. Marseille-P5729]